MLKRSRFLQVALGLLLIGQSLGAQQSTDFSSLEKTIRTELADAQIPGAAFAIVLGDRVVFARGYGIASAETRAPVTPDMLFRVGSVTKMFTATALTTLAEQGKLELDAPIGTYVKDLPIRLGQVSAHQLMSHTAGLRDEAPSYGSHDPESMARTIHSWNDEYFFTEPGRVFSYSNPGTTLAGYVAQQVSDRPFAKLLQELLFQPLGMTVTTFEPTVAMTYPLAQGHNVSADKVTVVRPFADNAAFWPAGFLFSSVNDLARFTIAFMNSGQIDGKTVLSQTVITKLATGYAATHSGAEGCQYGYGLMTREYRGVHVVEHGGSIDGFGALIRIVPEQQLAVIALTNRSGAVLPRSIEKAMELLLPLAPQTDTKASTITFTPADMRGWPGRYSHGPNVVEITGHNGKLFLKQGGSELPIQKLGDSRFATNHNGQSREFVIVRGTNGRVEYLHTGLRALARQP
jgi:CubicO group peptidase (beta-lactamase class C family)